jgi:hypothetical protein
MTLRRAIRLFVGAWLPLPEDKRPTFQEWLTACSAIESAIARDEQAVAKDSAARSVDS